MKTLVLVFMLLLSVSNVASGRELTSDEKAASEKFKLGFPHRHQNDYEITKLAVSLLETGMTKDEVIDLLGKPDKDEESESIWNYGIYYSVFLRIEFDEDGNLQKVFQNYEVTSDQKENRSNQSVHTTRAKRPSCGCSKDVSIPYPSRRFQSPRV